MAILTANCLGTREGDLRVRPVALVIGDLAVVAPCPSELLRNPHTLAHLQRASDIRACLTQPTLPQTYVSDKTQDVAQVHRIACGFQQRDRYFECLASSVYPPQCY